MAKPIRSPFSVRSKNRENIKRLKMLSSKFPSFKLELCEPGHDVKTRLIIHCFSVLDVVLLSIKRSPLVEKRTHLHLHHATDDITSMDINRDQGSQYTSRQFRYLATNDGSELVEIDKGFLLEFLDGLHAITICSETSSNLLAPHRLRNSQYDLENKTKMITSKYATSDVWLV